MRHQSAIITRYLSFEFTVPFLCSVVGFIALFLLLNLSDNLRDFKNVPGYQIFLYYVANQPKNLVNVIPMSILLATCYLTMNMGRHNELTALRAAGMSLARCAMPIWIVSLLSCVVVFAINESWGAASQQKAEQIYQEYVKHSHDDKMLSFTNPLDARDWTIGKVVDNTHLQNVVIRQYKDHAQSEFMIAAQAAEKVKGGWLMNDGFMQNYAEDGISLQENQQFFSEKVVPFEENVRDLETLQMDVEMLDIVALRKMVNNPYITSHRTLQHAKTMIWYRLTVPLASIVAALFAFSLTITTGRKGMMAGFAIAVAMLVCFIICGQGGVGLAKNGYVPPFVGGALMHLLFLCGAAYSMYRKQ